MSATCPELHELLELKSRPIDDSGRRHVEACPRCRNRLALYGGFVEPAGVPPGADVADAERRLAECFDRHRRVEAATPSSAPAIPSEVRAPAAKRRPSFGWAPRPVLALVAVLLVSAVVLMRPWSMGPPNTGALRQDSAPSPMVRLESPVTTADGGLRLSWARHPDADLYRVQVLGPDLAELLSRDVSETSLEFDPAELKTTPGAVLGWKVTALRAGAAIATSSMGTIRRP